MNTAQVVFIINLLQDINILRPLVYLAARELSLETCFLVTAAFRKRDKTGLWQQELCDIAEDTQSPIHDFENEFQALQVLQTGRGALVAGSESHLEAHRQVHDLFRIAPSQYVKITLQHGFECVGFLQGREQNLAHGSNITFAADIICGWCAPERLTAVSPSQRHKLRITGPTTLLPTPAKIRSGAALTAELSRTGLVCENMHSPRLNVAGDFKSEFLDIFEKFCTELDKAGQKVTLRPHPGGQYVIKNEVPLASNVVLQNAPIYKIDLTQFSYGISAPSSILIDLVLAGIPTAVWQDEANAMDHGNYEGLTRISTLDEWLHFAQDSVERPLYYLEKQQAFLKKQKLLISKTAVYREFTTLLLSCKEIISSDLMSQVRQQRILLIVPGNNPTVQFSFLKPLENLVASGEFVIDVISELHLNSEFKSERALFVEAREWLKGRIDHFRPTIAVFCRWSGPHTPWLLNYFSLNKIPTIYHIDDDLLNVPKEIGLDKWANYNQPGRIYSIRYLLDNSNLVYASTNKLKERFEEIGIKSNVQAGDIINSYYYLIPPISKNVTKIGYMGIGHEKDLQVALGAIVRYLKKNIKVSFEFFGTIPIPDVLLEFGDRISKVEKIERYDDFLVRLGQLKWDIGICPLTKESFNFLKSNVKWIEYTSSGVAVIASRGIVYDECCEDGCGILAATEEEWFDALEYLTQNHEERFNMVSRAQLKLKNEYSPKKLKAQVLSKFKYAEELFLTKNKKFISVPRKPGGKKILLVSNSFMPTVEIYFTNPLKFMVNSGDLELDFISEAHLSKRAWAGQGYIDSRSWLIDRFNNFLPDVVVFVRYSGPYAELLLDLARKRKIPIIYYIDDNLLGVPKELGHQKWEYHNNPDRISTVRRLLDESTLVLSSTKRLMNHIKKMGFKSTIAINEITCTLDIRSEARLVPVRKVGYLGGADHEHDFSTIIDAIVKLMRKHNELSFEFFGSMPIPKELNEFGNRISQVSPTPNYELFITKFASLDWDVGICPLESIEFNFMKTPIKWFDYTMIGAATVAARGTVYDKVCADDCGLLAQSQSEWFDSLDQLISNSDFRYRIASNAQERLKSRFSAEAYREKLLRLFSQAHQITNDSASKFDC